MSASALPEWTLSTPTRRRGEAERCRNAGAELNRAFDLFVECGSTSEAGSASGPLAGLPYAAKDMFDLPGRAPLCGLARNPADPSQVPAELMRRLDEAGARRIGLSRMSMLAYEPSGIGTARNPWNPDFAPGGSSSGSGAAVACGAALIAIGSDTAGSVRIPASCCGVTGLKPSPGLLPDEGAMRLAPSLDTIGILARGAADIAMVIEALGHDASAAAVADANAAIAVAEDLLDRCAAPVRAACEDGIAILAGMKTEVTACEAGPAVDRHGQTALRVLSGEAARTLGRFAGSGGVSKQLARRIASGQAVCDDTLRQDLAQRDAAKGDFLTSVFGDASFLVTPAMPIRVPALREVDPDAPGFTGRTLYALSAFLRFANYLGLPALVLPTGFDDRGMPVGLQIVGRPNLDRALLALGAEFQANSDWHGRVPPLARPILEATEGLVA